MAVAPSSDPVARAARERGYALGNGLARGVLLAGGALLVLIPVAAVAFAILALPPAYRTITLAIAVAGAATIAGIAGMIVAGVRRSRRRWHLGVPRDEAVKDGVGALLTEFAAGSILRLERVDEPGALQMVLVARRGSRRRVAFGLPDAAWVDGRYDAVHVALEAAGFPCWSASVHDPEADRFLTSMLSGERDAVAARAERLLREAADALEIGPDAYLRREIGGVQDPGHLRSLASDVETRHPGALGRWAAAWFRRRADESDRALAGRRPRANPLRTPSEAE